jgi:hypothetical protein
MSGLRLTREQTHNLLTEEQQRDVHGQLTEGYQYRFDAVADQITDSDGALGVGGFWSNHRIAKALLARGCAP